LEIRVPGDKSISHRSLLFGALARGGSRVRGILAGADPAATAEILRSLGVPVPALPSGGEELRIPGVGLRGLRTPSRVLDCMNSGTTARLLLGILAGQPLEATLTGDESLRKRPMARVVDPLVAMGAQVKVVGGTASGLRLPLEIRGGPLRPLQHRSPVASAQVKSAILLAGLVGGVRVEITEPRRSRDHTERLLVSAGVPLEEGPGEDGGWRVVMAEPPGSIPPFDLDVPGDPSSAAFFIALALLLDRELVIRGVGVNPTRTGILPVLERMGARVEVVAAGEAGGEPVADLVVRGGSLRATEIGGDEIPALIDEIPVLAILAARAEGTTRITGAEELRVKESDRIRALVENLKAVGVEVEELPDGLEITGTDAPLSGKVRTHHDHRIAMAFGVLGTPQGNSLQVEGASIVDVSFPGFWELLKEVAEAPTPPAPRPGSEGESGPDAPLASPELAPEGGPVITLDGPAGSGKSSTAKEVARRLGFRHLDSGSLYRGLTVALREAGIPQEDWSGLGRSELDAIPLRLLPGNGALELRLGERLLGEEIRDPEVTASVPVVARLPAVREWLLGMQRSAARWGGLVADGRDMGTVVFPQATLKVFLTAELGERARRRYLQQGGGEGGPQEVEVEARRIEARDRSDRDRPTSPLREPEGALVLDTTHLDFEEQVERVVAAARASGLDTPRP
jgi:3-phosphoshikimate 1-carboxyvinyltransferase